MSNVTDAVVVDGGFGRQHIFAVENRDDFFRKVQGMALAMIGIELRVAVDTPLSRMDTELGRLGVFGDDESITSLAEFKYGDQRGWLTVTDVALL